MRKPVGSKNHRHKNANDDDDDGVEVIVASGAVAYFPRKNHDIFRTNSRASPDPPMGDSGLETAASSSISSDCSSFVGVDNPNHKEGNEGMSPPRSSRIDASSRSGCTTLSSLSSESLAPPRRYLLSNDVSSPVHGLVFVENDKVEGLARGHDASNSGGDIYARMDSFEEKLDHELQDLENFGVGSGASDAKNTAFDKGKDKIMSAYQSHLDKIQHDDMDGFSSSDEAYEFDDDERYNGTFPLDENECYSPERHDRYGPPRGRSRGNGRTYIRSCFQSERVKKNIAIIALQLFIVIIISITAGVISSEKSNAIDPDWEAEYRTELKEEAELFAEIHEQQEMEGPRPEELSAAIDELNSPPDWQGPVSNKNKGDAEEEEKKPSGSVGEETKEQLPSESAAAIDEHDSPPEGQEQISDTEKSGAEEPTGTVDLYSNAITKYQPIMYDRTKGWNGQTYKEAAIFCYVAAGMAVCPYDAICPDDTRGEPLGGFRDGPQGDWAWMPILNGYNEWVQVGAREKCVKYSDKFGGERPGWGETGKGVEVEGVTQNLMCCANVM